ncbi:methyl-accepting chemotaxis protein [Thiovibrio frasassiensis]|uniref:Methyl-accepting chemotaxis protein n=1 Tax=Thiovibrio frasassiensis TaxID=2984131 RepID=A0A9X4MFG8_9BACT|nr:methyl-accepting chemotaxis protein [Thiovibrio frasassiensis]MDG4475338.1 methyl-accepting chemotaxis protein [Thiovibrio frasassiensis]
MFNFSKLTIGTKIKGGFGFLVILSVMLGGFGFWKATLVDIGVSDLDKTHLPLTLMMGAVSETALRQELAMTNYALHREEKFAEHFKELDATEDQNFAKMKEIIRQDEYLVGEHWLDKIDAVAGGHDHFATEAKGLMAAVAANDQSAIDTRADAMAQAATSFKKTVRDFEATNTAEAKSVAGEALGQSQSSKFLMGVISLCVLIFGAAFAITLVRQITRPLNRAIESLNDGSAQVASASGQVAGASQMLAEGASEQAAAIEETSSALEELTAMTKQNAGNATEADGLMQETMQTVDRVNTSMGELTATMNDVSTASQATFKIIKTIDEIAFQTNLLALNAAVEAARAGEAGAGFAVVADEVRNLAMRAAEAAKNTADLIEGTVKRVQDSTGLLATTNAAFGELAARSAKVNQLVNEISVASTEQAQGVDQINNAVTEMDAVVQQNAATAEESASASEELSAQAEVMKSTIGDLIAMVGGQALAHQRDAGQYARAAQVSRKSPRQQARPVLRPHGAASAQRFLPLDGDEDFVDFGAAA